MTQPNMPGPSWEKEATLAAEKHADGLLQPPPYDLEKWKHRCLGFYAGAKWERSRAQEKAFLNKQKGENTMNKEAYELMQATLEFYANAGGPVGSLAKEMLKRVKDLEKQ